MTQNQFYMAQIGAKREQWQAELAEATRAHQAQEAINTLQYNESLRHNMAMEREATRTNMANEYLNQMRNNETARHDVESESISRYSAESDNTIGNRNASVAELRARTDAGNLAVNEYNADTNRINARTSRNAQIANESLGKDSADRDARRVAYEERESVWRNRERWSNILNTTIKTASGTVKDIMGASGGLIKLFS